MSTLTEGNTTNGCRCATLLDVTKRFHEMPGDWEVDPCCAWHEVWRRSAVERVLVIDIRDDVKSHEVPGAIHMPMGTFLSHMYKRTLVDEEDEVIIFCNTDNRSAMAVVMCRALGYLRVRKINGGYQEYIRLISQQRPGLQRMAC